MPGYSAKYVKPNESQGVSDFIQELRLQQLRLKTDLRGSQATKGLADEQPLKLNVARLEALDRLSLHFSMNPEQDLLLDGVPVDDRGQEADIELHAEGGGVVAVDPYPFRRDPLAFSIMARRVPKKVYASDLDFQKALAAARYFPLKFTMRALRAGAFSHAAGV